ncbi:thiaminase II [Haloferacaceae archaeon DSL9]
MALSDDLLRSGADIWDAQYDHPFVRELAAGTLDEAAFEHWVVQDYRYLLDYARVYALAGVKATDEETMGALLGVAHAVLDTEMDLHRSFADDYGISRAELETTEKAPTCTAYTDFLVRTGYEGSLPEIVAVLFPCMQGYLDVATHMADLATETHAYTPFIEMYTSEEFREATADVRALVDRAGERYPGHRESMEAVFRTSARLELAFWEMAYTQEAWSV